MSQIVYLSLCILAVSFVVSTSLGAVFHLLIAVPILKTFSEIKWRKLPLSIYFLLGYCFVIVLSVIFNQEINANGYKAIFKIKYFIIGTFAIFPVYKFRKDLFTPNRIKILLYLIMVSATLASVSGLIGLYTGFNPLKFSKACHLTRNCGLSGMYMNYAHTLVFLQVIFFGLLLCKNQLKELISARVLWIVFFINLLGLILSYTRGAWIGLFAALPFFFIREQLKKMVVTFVILITIAGALFATNSEVRETILNRKASNDERIGSWKAAIKAFEERPIWGYGYLNFEPHSVEIKEKYQINNAYYKGHAHNNFLQVLADTGILGIFFFVGWIVFWIVETVKRDDLIAKFTLPLIICFIFSGLTQSTIILANNQFIILAIYMMSKIDLKCDEIS